VSSRSDFGQRLYRLAGGSFLELTDGHCLRPGFPISPRDFPPRSAWMSRLCTGGRRPALIALSRADGSRAAMSLRTEAPQASPKADNRTAARGEGGGRARDRATSGTAQDVTEPGHLRGGALGRAGRPPERREASGEVSRPNGGDLARARGSEGGPRVRARVQGAGDGRCTQAAPTHEADGRAASVNRVKRTLRRGRSTPARGPALLRVVADYYRLNAALAAGCPRSRASVRVAISWRKHRVWPSSCKRPRRRASLAPSRLRGKGPRRSCILPTPA
jgi:hypothetical protein